MRLLIFTLEYPPFKGGVAVVYGTIKKYWPEPENIFVLDNNKGKLISRILPKYKWIPSIWRLWFYVKRKKIDHVIVGHILPLGISAFILSKFMKIKYSIYLHGLDYNVAFKTERKSWIVQKILNNADKIICSNSYVAGLVKEEQGKKCEDKIIISNPTILPEKINEGLAKQLKEKYQLEGKIVMLSISRLVKRKGFDHVLEVMPEIIKEVPNAYYFIGGGGPDEEYLKEKWQALPEDIRSHVQFLGRVTDEEKWAWLSVCDMFLMPSRKINGDVEGFGIVYLEANLAGKAVVAGNSGGVGDAVVNNVNGFLVNPDDKNEIVRAIIRLALDKELRCRLGVQGEKRALNEFSPKTQIELLYKKLNS